MIDKMKSRNRPRNKFGVTASFLLFAALFAACDTGLGESVDTMAPVITISSPAASDVLSGPINLSGSCLDDKMVSIVSVSIVDTTTGKQVLSSTIGAGGLSWSTTINTPVNGVYPLKDGIYSANVKCYDAVGRESGVASRVFEVDNTAPVFCVTSPNSLNIEDPAAYGRSVKIKGEIADDHAIKQMDIRVFKTDESGGNPVEITSSLAKTTFSGFETAGGTEIKIAQYYPDDSIPAAGSDDYPLYQNYMAMYRGTELGKNAKFYVFPFLTDIAGNTSSNCYIQTQLKKLVSDACEVETTSDSLQTAQFKKMLNGSYSLNELDVDTVKKILDGTYVQTATSYSYWSHMTKDDPSVAASNALLAMSVNSNNSPMYEFGGYAVSKSTFTEANSGGQITIRISAGLDGTPVKPSTLKVYLWECDDTTALLKPGADLKKPETASYSSANGDFTVTTDGTTPVSSVTESVTSGSYTVTLPANLVGGNHYLMTALGEDDDENELFSDNKYAFTVTLNANAPSVDFDGQFFTQAGALAIPAAGDTSAAKYAYKAVIDIEDKIEKSMKEGGSKVQILPVLYKGYYAAKTELGNVTPNWIGSQIEVSSADIEVVDASQGTYKAAFSLNVFPIAEYKADNYTIALKILAKNKVATSELTTYIFWADNAKPQLEISSPDNNANIYEGDSNFVSAKTNPPSGTYTARGKWSDIEGSGTSRLWVSDIESAVPYKKAEGTAKATADGSTVYYKKTVNQQSGAEDYCPIGSLASGTDAKEFYYLDWTNWTEISGVSQTTSETNWNAPILLGENVGKSLAFAAMDEVGYVSDIGQNQKRTGLTFDFGIPEATLTSEPSAPSAATAVVQQYYTADQADDSGYLNFKIKASDTFKIASLDIKATVVKNKSDGTPAAPVTLTADDDNYGFKIETSTPDDKTIVKTVKIATTGIGDGVWTISALARDAAGRPSAVDDKTKEAAFTELVATTIDCVKPAFVNYSTESGDTIRIGSDKQGRASAWYKDQTLTVWGKVNEAASGLSMVYYWLQYPGRTDPVPTSNEFAQKSDGSVVIGGTAGDSILYKIMPDKFAQTKRTTDPTSGEIVDTNNILYVQAIDQAGNKCEPVTYSIKEDQTPPAVSSAFYTYDNGVTMTAASGSVMTNGEKDLTLYGAVSDELSGMDSLSFKIESDDITGKTTIYYSQSACSSADDYKAVTDWSESCGAPKSWKAIIKGGEGGALTSGDLYATASDKAENSSEQKAFALVVDTEAPKVVLTGPTTVLASEVSATKKPSNINGSVIVKGTASDDNGLAKIEIFTSVDYATENPDGTDTPKAKPKWEPLGLPITDSSMYNWSADAIQATEKVDATATSPATFKMFGYDDLYDGTAKPLWVKISALDKASNKGEYIYKYKIDPDGDRPKITITNVALDKMTSANYAWRTGSNDIYGSVSDDDDGTIAIKYSTDGGSNWNDPTIDGTSFTVSGLADGPHVLTFKVTDGAGTEFVSSPSASFVSPKLYGKDDGKESGAFDKGDTQLYVTIDTAAPTVGEKTYQIYSAKGGSYGEKESSLRRLGGDRSKFQFNVQAFDTNGVKSVSVTINGITTTQTERTKVDVGGIEYDYFEVSDIDVSNLPEDTYTATIEIEDKAGQKKTDTMPVEVDNTKPGIDITSPATDGKIVLGTNATASGTVTEYGTTVVGEGTSAKTLSTIYYAICPIPMGYVDPDDETETPVTTLPQSFNKYYNDSQDKWIELKDKAGSSVVINQGDGSANAKFEYKIFDDAAMSWKVAFDKKFSETTGTHAATLNDFIDSYKIAAAADIISCDFEDLVRLYLWIKAVDEVGNETEVCRQLIVDPQGDRPQISFGYPESSGKSVGGTVALNGAVTDNAHGNEEAKFDTVWLQIISDKDNRDTAHGSYTYNKDTGALTGFTLTPADIYRWVAYKDNSGKALYSVYDMRKYVIGGSNNEEHKLKEDNFYVNKDSKGNITNCSFKDQTVQMKDFPYYGILANFSGTTWSCPINSAGEFNKNDDTNEIAARVYAYNGKQSRPDNRVMTFDAQAPKMSDRYLRQYKAGGAVSSSRPYLDNVFVRDKDQDDNVSAWHVTFTLTDDDKIAKVGFSEVSADAAERAASDVSSSTYCTDKSTARDWSEVAVKYPLKTNVTVGKETLYVYYQDARIDNPGKGHYTFTVNHDNQNPVLAEKGSADFKISPNVFNKDGWYVLGSKVNEDSVGQSDQSKFARAVVYFLRRGSKKVFDPMYSKYHKIGDNDAYYTKTDATGVEYKEGLYWKKKTVTVNGGVVTLGADDANIHEGGLAKIDGLNYRITSKTGTELAIDSATEYNGTEGNGKDISAYFALGNVVDNILIEDENEDYQRNFVPGYGYGYGSTKPAHANDDGDLMIEQVSTIGGVTNWEAWIYSKNIPDGPIDICYTVYDKAGNYAYGSVTNTADGAYVSNNAPRLANVTVSTDYNGNDKIDAGESLTWFPTSKASWEEAESAIVLHGGDKKAAATDPDYTSAYITAKGMTWVAPEVIGGNGDLYYSWSYPKADGSGNANGYNTTAFMDGDTGTSGSREDQAAAKSGNIILQVGDLKKALKGNTDGKGKYEFKVYDSTEETVYGSSSTFATASSQHADITLYMDNQVADGVAPTGQIARFYWNDINDNSIYGSSSASDPKDLRGHIELEGDLPAANFAQSSGEYDKDPKVSGKIVIRGEAFDAIRLDSLYVTLPNFVDSEGHGLVGLVDSGKTGTSSAKFYTMATFDAANSAWKYAYKTSTGESSAAVDPVDFDANGWSFKVESSEFDADGHHVTWSLALDTIKYNGGTTPADTDVLVEFMALDMGAPTCATGTKYTSVDGTTKYAATSYAAKTPSDYSGNGGYKMDIVPYITKVYTNLAKANTSNWSVFNRTAGGAYPVHKYVNSNKTSAKDTPVDMTVEDGEVVQIYGFNLNGLTYTAALTATAKRQDPNADYDCYDFAAGDLTGTGSQEVAFTVGSVSTLNNVNANDAKGDYSGEKPGLDEEYGYYANFYNRLPNDSNNNRLSDDVKFDVWQLNDSAAVPISNKILDPVMKINPKNGLIGFAFENDPTYFSMPTSAKSYNYWAGCFDKITVPAFDYTQAGGAVALAQGNDISGSNADNFVFFYSEWSQGAAHSEKATGEQENGIALEQIGYNWGGKNYWDKSRFQGTSVVTAKNHVYLAYYDRVTKGIRFRSSLGKDVPDTRGDMGNIKSRNNYGTGHGIPVISNWDTLESDANSQMFAGVQNSLTAGDHLCLAAIPEKGAARTGAGASGNQDLVAIVWYDGSNCNYSVNTTPEYDRAGYWNTNNGNTGWEKATPVFNGAGKYCKIAFDANGGVHIAAYDSENSAVLYAYSASATSPAFKTCKVDASESGGAYLTLDVALENIAKSGETATYAPIPQIGYYGSSCAKPKLARYAGAKALSAASDTEMAGADGNYLTGVWEISAIPSTSNISKDRVNVALRKTLSKDGTVPAGAITNVLNSGDAGKASYYYNNASGYDSESLGMVYGLANTNAVLGYCRAVGAKTYIETAQRK